MPRRKVMISSTVLDLPEHREEIQQGCERAGFDAHVMEHLPALDADAIEASLRMVAEADIYVGVFAYRYGYVPDGYDISITEMEYNRAADLKKPRLVFFIHQDHSVTGKDVETGVGATRLQALKDRIGRERVVALFKSPADLRAHVVEALANLNKTLDATARTETFDKEKHSLRRARIFMSYRRSDSRHFAGRLYDRLSTEVDEDCLYMDVETARVGRNFVVEVKEAVLRCDVLLVIIGQNWLTCCETNGRRLIDDPNDLLRVEISTALTHQIRVVPVLVDDTKIPAQGDLPEDIGELIFYQALSIRHEHFRFDVNQLLQELTKLLGGRDA
jgi:uncharacterized protein DUF4062/TIR domain-containing protein